MMGKLKFMVEAVLITLLMLTGILLWPILVSILVFCLVVVVIYKGLQENEAQSKNKWD